MNKEKFEEYDNKRKLLNEWTIQQFKLQDELIMKILRDGNELCGLVGVVSGENGTYEVESIYLEEENLECEIVCHLNYPAFEADVLFEDFSIWERQQMIELVFKCLKEQNSSESTTAKMSKSKRKSDK